jgi:hypothetical protein
LGDFVEPLALSLKLLNSNIWEKEFHEKLTKAADNTPYEIDDNKPNNSHEIDDNKPNKPHVIVL